MSNTKSFDTIHLVGDSTFTALPYAVDTLASHPKLCVVSMAGLLCNMTRNRHIHAVWCVAAMLLLTCSNIDW